MAAFLQGRHALVTGAGRGIGAAIARELAEAGAAVTLVGRTSATLAETSAGLKGARTQCQEVDVTNLDSVRAGFAAARSAFGPVTVLINNAGQASSAPLAKTSDELWDAMLAVNLSGTFYCMRECLPDMLEAGFGRIVNVASTAGLTGYPYVSAYCAAKHGVVGLTRAIALETARRNVTVNAVCPGYTDTDLVRDAVSNVRAKTGRSEAEALAELVQHNPQRRLISPVEVAKTVLWLCSPGSESITGQSVAIAGGEIQ